MRTKANFKDKLLPVFVETDASGLYVVECPLFQGCYTQGKTLDEAIKNIKEVIALCLSEKNNRDVLSVYTPQAMSLHTILL